MCFSPHPILDILHSFSILQKDCTNVTQFLSRHSALAACEQEEATQKAD